MVLLASSLPYFNYLTTALNSLQTNVLAVVQFLAGGILTISFLWSIYEAFVKGGDVRSLGLSFLKYGCVTFIVAYWDTVFRDVVACFEYVSTTLCAISTWDTWIDGLKAALSTGQGLSFSWDIIAGGSAAIISFLFVLLGYLVLPFALFVFTLFYVFWGVVLYAVGPLVLALMPSGTLGVFHRRWIENLFVWNCWPVLASLFMLLMTAVGLANPSVVMGSTNGVMGYMTGLDNIGMLGTASLLIAVFIVTIPLTAKKILIGDFSALAVLLLIASRLSRLGGHSGSGGASETRTVARGSGSGGGAITAQPSAAYSGISPNCTLGSPPDTPPPSGETRLFNVSRG